MSPSPDREQKHRLQISISNDRYEQVKAAAEKQGVSVSAWINIAIAAQLEEQKK